MSGFIIRDRIKMGTSVNKKKIAFYSVITVVLVVFGIIFPIYHLYDPLFGHEPVISVENGYYDVTYSGDFKNITDTANSFLFTTNASRSTVIDSWQPNSTLDVRATNGQIFFVGTPNDVVTIFYNLVVSGHFTSNLHPNSVTISFGALGPNQSSVLLTTIAPPQSTFVPPAENLSPNSLGNLRLIGQGYTNVNANLLNESSNLPFYNFNVSVPMQLTVKWSSGSTHLFSLSAQVNGLSKPVNSTLSMIIIEVG